MENIHTQKKEKHITQHHRSMYFSTIVTLIVAIIIFCNAEIKANDITPGDSTFPCPCKISKYRPSMFPGHYFTATFYPHKPVLFTNMALDEFVGYLLFDSLLTHSHKTYPSASSQQEFIDALTCGGDTLGYALRYLYRLADINPLLYFNFRTSKPMDKQNVVPLLTKLYDHVKKVCGHKTKEIMVADYILHLRTTKVEQFDYTSHPRDTTRIIYSYNQVLDTIKGQILPDFTNAITIFRQDSAGTPVERAKKLIVPPNTNFLYFYNIGWVQNSVDGKKSQSMRRIPMEEDKEYIVFTKHTFECIQDEFVESKFFYDLRTLNLNFQGGLFPIIDGMVIDGANDWGWGTEVPVETFKQNLRDLIDSIKNYE